MITRELKILERKAEWEKHRKSQLNLAEQHANAAMFLEELPDELKHLIWEFETDGLKVDVQEITHNGGRIDFQSGEKEARVRWNKQKGIVYFSSTLRELTPGDYRKQILNELL